MAVLRGGNVNTRRIKSNAGNEKFERGRAVVWNTVYNVEEIVYGR